MVYNTHNCWVFGLCPSSSILKTRKLNVSETGSVSILRWGGKTPTQLGPLERANLNHCEHRHNLQEGLIENSKLAQHACEEGHRVGWDDARILETESNSRYRKYKESAHMVCLSNPISQPSLDISSIWIHLISNEAYDSQRRSVTDSS
jgi:hypothetical protein